MRFWLPLVFLLVVPFLVTAQGPTDYPESKMLKELVPNPTKHNGYEEFIVAGEMIHSYFQSNSPEVATYPKVSLTDSQKRKIITDNQEAMKIFRIGLSKPIFPVRAQVRPDTPLPEFTVFRDIATVIILEAEINLADGKVNSALVRYQEAIRFVQIFQGYGRVGLQVAHEVTKRTCTALKRHVKQLSKTDCVTLASYANRDLQLVDPLSMIIRSDAMMVQSVLQNPGNPPCYLSWGSYLPGDTQVTFSEATKLYNDQDQRHWDREVRQAFQLADSHFQTLMQELQKLPRDRKLNFAPSKDRGGQNVARILVSDYTEMNQWVIENQTELRLLAIHAAIIGYWWNNEVFPKDLKTLKLGDLTTDPTSGRPFHYAIVSDSYELTLPPKGDEL